MFTVGTKINLIGDPIIDYWDDCFTDTITIKNGGALNVEDNLNFLLKNEIVNFNVYMGVAFKRPNYLETETPDEHSFLDYHAKLYENLGFTANYEKDIDYQWQYSQHSKHPYNSWEVGVSPSWYTPIKYNNSVLIISNYDRGFLRRNWQMIREQYKNDNRQYDLIIVDSKYDMYGIDELFKIGKKVIIRQSHTDSELRQLHCVPDYYISSNSKEGVIEIYEGTNKHQILFDPIDVSNEYGNDIGAGDVFTACLASYLVKDNLKFDTESLINIVQKSSDKVRIAIQKSKFTCSLV